MSIEGGARCGYVNPDETTFEYLRGKPYAPKSEVWERALSYWRSVRSDSDARYDDVVRIAAHEIEPVVTWGITPGQSTPVGGAIPELSAFEPNERGVVEEAYKYMSFEPGSPIKGKKIDVAFIGSCTNFAASIINTAAGGVLITKSKDLSL
jgi:3-isopropylmalate/(R)-2-methylmalate dehydratase large subunit